MMGSFTPLFHVWQWVDQEYLPYWSNASFEPSFPGYLWAEYIFGALFWYLGLFMVAIGVREIVASCRRQTHVPN